MVPVVIIHGYYDSTQITLGHFIGHHIGVWLERVSDNQPVMLVPISPGIHNPLARLLIMFLVSHGQMFVEYKYTIHILTSVYIALFQAPIIGGGEAGIKSPTVYT